MTKSRAAVNHWIPGTDRAVQSSKDENSRAGLATFRDREVSRVRANVSNDASWRAKRPRRVARCTGDCHEQLNLHPSCGIKSREPCAIVADPPRASWE